ncbi:SgrR family transcriptional regulator [Paenibacillus sp. P26]|nr:SgrR family transcriptional regulator [Paenibacillus sp. P26]
MLEVQYLQLYQAYPESWREDQPAEVTIAELTLLWNCSDRNVKMILKKMEACGWIEWRPGRGRGMLPGSGVWRKPKPYCWGMPRNSCRRDSFKKRCRCSIGSVKARTPRRSSWTGSPHTSDTQASRKPQNAKKRCVCPCSGRCRGSIRPSPFTPWRRIW